MDYGYYLGYQVEVRREISFTHMICFHSFEENGKLATRAHQRQAALAWEIRYFERIQIMAGERKSELLSYLRSPRFFTLITADRRTLSHSRLSLRRFAFPVEEVGLDVHVLLR